MVNPPKLCSPAVTPPSYPREFLGKLHSSHFLMAAI
jgi:hypothetical protein